MSVQIRIPANMRPLAGDRSVVEVAAATVGEAFQELLEQYPELYPRLLNESRELQSFVNVFVQQKSIRDLQGLETPLTPGAEILIIPALAGG